MAITILDHLYHHEPALKEKDSISMADTERHGLPFFSGCQQCGANLAPYNAYPSKTGYIRCKDCIDDMGFETVHKMVEWEIDQVTGD